jgi:hypothetical protein
MLGAEIEQLTQGLVCRSWAYSVANFRTAEDKNG